MTAFADLQRQSIIHKILTSWRRKVIKSKFPRRIVQRFILWGLLLGTIESILFYYFYSLAYYGILGILLNAIVGGILGLLNGLILALNSSAKNTTENRKAILTFSIVLTFLFGIFLYSLIYYPLAQTLEGNFNLTGTILLSIFPTIIATIIAGYANVCASGSTKEI